MPNEHKAAIQLPKNKKNMVIWGSICLMLSIAMFGLSLATLQQPILEEMNAANYFSLLSIFGTLGLSIMTPIGGKLGDLFGRRNLIIISGIICAVCGIGMGFIRQILPFMFLRLLLGAAQGAFTSAPYILMREINDAKDVPKAMGLLASAVAFGGFGGSIIAGFLTDRGWLEAAIIFPVIPLLLGIFLIAFALPNHRRSGKVLIDVKGILTLAVGLSGILLALNLGARIGWGNIWILSGFLLGIISLIILIKIEKNAKEPLIPLHLFKNRKYNLLLLIGFLCFFYNTAMNYYAPLAVLQILGQNTTISGALQFPRTILTIALPTLCGIWVSKNSKNIYLSMLGSVILVGTAFLILSFTNTKTSVLIYFIMLALTGIAESLRSVSITPAAQATLSPQDLGVGTALTSFANSLSNLFASVIFGLVYDMQLASNPSNLENIISGINSVFLTASVVTFVGILPILAFARSKKQ